MDIFECFILLAILCFSTIFVIIILKSYFSSPKALPKAPEKMKMQNEKSVETHSKIRGADKTSSTIKREFPPKAGYDKVSTELHQEKSDKVLPNEKGNISSSLSRPAVSSPSVKLWSTIAAGRNIKEREKPTELWSKRFEEMPLLNQSDNSPVDNGQQTVIVKSAKRNNNSLRKSTKTSTTFKTSIFEKPPPLKIERNLLPVYYDNPGSTTHDDATALRSSDEQTTTKPLIGKNENLQSVTAEAKPYSVGVAKQKNTHEAQASNIKTTLSVQEENYNQTLLYSNGPCLKQDVAMPTGSLSKSQPAFGASVVDVNRPSVISAMTIPLGGASAVRGSPLKKNIRTKELPSHMDTDDEDKENTNIAGAKNIMDKTSAISFHYTSQMEDEDIYLNEEAAAAQDIQSMDVEDLRKYRRKNKPLDEENMISDSDTETDNDGMMVEIARYEPYIDEDFEMADISNQKTTAANSKFLPGLPSANNAKSTLVSQVTVKPNVKQTVLPKTNHSIVGNQPSANDSPQCFRKTLNRVQLSNNQKMFVVKKIPVAVLPTSKQANQTVVGVRFRRQGASQGEIASKDDTLSRATSSPGLLQSTEDCALKKEAKRIIPIEQSIGFEKDLDNSVKKTKKLSEEPPIRENTALTKRKERWTRSKAMMKKGNSLSESGQPKDVEFTTEMDVNNIEVCGIDCDICYRRFLFMECTWCPNNDKICLTCIKEVIKDTLDNKKLCLECPREVCRATISLDLLSKKVDQVTVEILERKLLKRLEKAQAETFERLYDTISCPVCQNQIILNIDSVHVFCTRCHKELCSYCQHPWNSVSHNECSLLNYCGQKCFTSQDLPANWVRLPPKTETNQTIVDVESFSDVDLRSSEGKEIIRLFTASMKCWVTSITKVQTIKLWEKYALKRRHMVDELGLSDIKERALFHGTESSNISLICQEGFDMRVKTVNGSVYGKGVYFSTYSKYSHDYSKGSNTMFIARVLCGKSTIGNRDMFRPPKDASGRLYDTCVNEKQSIYVVFDNAQCFPAYIIKYDTKF